jgi:hypothetical protein
LHAYLYHTPCSSSAPGQFGTCVFFFDCYRMYFTSLFFLSLVSIFLINLLLFHVNFMVW